MRHTLSRFLITTHVIELIANKYKLSLEKAMDAFYSSETVKLLAEDETGLYGESFLYVFSLFEQEMISKKDS